MEANRPRRGMKAKMGMSFYRATKPSSMPYSNNVKPPPPSSMASLGFVAEENIGFIHTTFTNRKVSLAAKKEAEDRASSNQVSSFGGSLSSEQENVDSRATTYITYVKERLRMEQIE